VKHPGLKVRRTSGEVLDSEQIGRFFGQSEKKSSGLTAGGIEMKRDIQVL